jgi:hypothetical protein
MALYYDYVKILLASKGSFPTSVFNPTPRLLTKTNITSIANSDVSSIEDSIGQLSKHTDLYII